MRTVRPVAGKVMLRPVAARPQAGGIALPDTSRKDYREAIVAGVAASAKTELVPGDRVLLPPYGGGGTEVNIGGEVFVFIGAGELEVALE